MPDVCMDCGGGRWECGDENELCGSAEDWTTLGVANLETGLGHMTLAVTVSVKEGESGCLVKLVTGGRPEPGRPVHAVYRFSKESA